MYRPRIGIYGRMNAGKSSLFNFLLSSQEAIVSSTPGTTTDPVRKAYELIGYGAVTLIDTAGFDDTRDELSNKRVAKSMATINDVDLAIFVAAFDELDAQEQKFVDALDIPCIVVYKPFQHSIFDEIRRALSSLAPIKTFYGAHLQAGQRVLLVAPIDGEAPAGRLILPQVQALRAALDMNAYATIVQPQQMEAAVEMFKPHLIVVDSQLFGSIDTPPGVELTSFSILLSEYKGDIELYRQGVEVAKKLKDGDKILLIEHCLHGVSCEDIARVKIPRALQAYTGASLCFDIVSGREPLPDDLSQYALAVQCGGCMTTPRSIATRIARCTASHLPITSYGVLLQFLVDN